jgi:hypothetical protein
VVAVLGAGECCPSGVIIFSPMFNNVLSCQASHPRFPLINRTLYTNDNSVTDCLGSTFYSLDSERSFSPRLTDKSTNSWMDELTRECSGNWEAKSEAGVLKYYIYSPGRSIELACGKTRCKLARHVKEFYDPGTWMLIAEVMIVQQDRLCYPTPLSTLTALKAQSPSPPLLTTQG